MKRKTDGAGVGAHASRPLIATLGLSTITPETADATLPEDIRWTPIAQNQTTESRRNRIATVAYYLSERRGFEPGHEAADWLRAEAEIDALDLALSLNR